MRAASRSAKKFLVIGHRGFSSRYPENTMIALEKAFEVGADGVEFDVRLTSDGHLVLFHDDDLKRLCGRPGSIEKLTLNEVRELRVFGKEPIPILDDVLEHFHTSVLNIEIKMSSRDAVVVESVMRCLTKHRHAGRILISSFSPEVLDCLQTMDPKKLNGQTGILVETAHLADLPAAQIRWQASTWNVPRQILSAPWKTRWGKIEIPPLWVWTVDEPHDWGAICQSELPFEAIITNKPDALSQFLCRLPEG